VKKKPQWSTSKLRHEQEKKEWSMPIEWNLKSTYICITHLELIDKALKEEKCTLNTQETIEKNTHNILY
jgi:hypothetical protein